MVSEEQIKALNTRKDELYKFINIKVKQTVKIGDWEKLHPNYREDPQLLDEWQNMLAGITEDTAGNALKQKLALKRKIDSYIELKDAMGIK